MNADYVLACGVVWGKTADPEAGWDLVDGLKSRDPEVRLLAQTLLVESGESSMGLLESALAVGIVDPDVAGPLHGRDLENSIRETDDQTTCKRTLHGSVASLGGDTFRLKQATDAQRGASPDLDGKSPQQRLWRTPKPRDGQRLLRRKKDYEVHEHVSSVVHRHGNDRGAGCPEGRHEPVHSRCGERTRRSGSSVRLRAAGRG